MQHRSKEPERSRTRHTWICPGRGTDIAPTQYLDTQCFPLSSGSASSVVCFVSVQLSWLLGSCEIQCLQGHRPAEYKEGEAEPHLCIYLGHPMEVILLMNFYWGWLISCHFKCNQVWKVIEHLLGDSLECYTYSLSQFCSSFWVPIAYRRKKTHCY